MGGTEWDGVSPLTPVGGIFWCEIKYKNPIGFFKIYVVFLLPFGESGWGFFPFGG